MPLFILISKSIWRKNNSVHVFLFCITTFTHAIDPLEHVHMESIVCCSVPRALVLFLKSLLNSSEVLGENPTAFWEFITMRVGVLSLQHCLVGCVCQCSIVINVWS